METKAENDHVGGRCVFCGALNGSNGSEPQQHRPRCRYRGPANDFSVDTPNYYKMIDEDNPTWLERYRAWVHLPIVQKHLDAAELRIQNFEEKQAQQETDEYLASAPDRFFVPVVPVKTKK